MTRVPSLPLAALAGEMLRIQAWLDSDELWTDEDIAAARGFHVGSIGLRNAEPSTALIPAARPISAVDWTPRAGRSVIDP